MNDWREVLSRALDGETLSPDEAEQLSEALADETNWGEACAWFQFEQAVSGRLQEIDSSDNARERLLAKSLLRDKHAEIVVRATSPISDSRATRHSTPWRRWWRLTAVVAACLAAAVLLFWPRDQRSDLYASPLIQGDFHILGPATVLSRGDRLISGGDGAQLALGGYCDVQLVAHSDISVRGAPHREAIELHQGGLRARVMKSAGKFRVLTPLGAVEVQGTEFETTVEYPNGLPGDLSMKDATKKVVVTVAVLSGAVLCHFSDPPVLLQAGSNRAFAGQVGGTRTTGEVVALADFSVTLKAKGKSVTFHVPKGNKFALHEVGDLIKGDKVTVAWVEEDGRKWVRDVDGEGVVEGTVTALGDAWIEVRLKGGRKKRYRAPWRGGNPADGGGPDRVVVRKLGGVRVRDRVAVTWAMPEGKRVMDVKVLQRASRPAKETASRVPLTKAPPELYGLSGRVVGRLVRKDVEKGELTLKIVKVDKVWRNNKAKNPRSAEGRTLKIEGVFGKFLDVLLLLKENDGVQIEVKHVRGDGLTFLGEGLKKVEIKEQPPQAGRTDDRPKRDDALPGLNGFRGILIGKLVRKDVEKGTLAFKMEKVKRIWKANKAPAPEKSKGKLIRVEGISGKFLDTLLVLEIGDRIEVEAFHVRGTALKFPGEWLKKAE